MSELRIYRLLIVATTFANICSIILHVHDKGWPPNIDSIFACFFVIGLIILPLNLGLFFFSRLARTVSLGIAILLIIPFWNKARTQSAPHVYFFDLANVMWGAILSMAYFSSLKGKFISKNSTEFNPRDGQPPNGS